jgi:hypothetical protein
MATTASTATVTQAPQATSGGNNIFSAAASVVNNVVSGIFNSGTQKKELALQDQQQRYNQTLSTLTASQQYAITQKMNAAETETERMQILADALTQINATATTSNSANSYKTAMIVLGAAIITITTIYLIKRNE